MSRRRARARTRALLLVLLAVFVGAPETSAQVSMHREVPRGEVTGLEMGIEGTLEAVPGAPVRWWVTLYEVVRRRDLRAAAGCSIRVLASHDRAEPIVTATTDASGRAALVMPMPTSIDETPHVVLDATCPRGVRRLFDVDLVVTASERLVLAFDRDTVPPAGSALLLGRLIDLASGRGRAGVEVDVSVRQGGPVGAPRRVTTDASGVFSTRVDAGEGTEPIVVVATTVRDEGPISTGSARLAVGAPPAPPPLAVRITPSPPVAAPGALVDLTVEVRGADGLPVEGALVTGPLRDPRPAGETEPLPEIRTDARGIAHHPWRLSRDLDGGALTETSTAVTVTSTALGSHGATATVRVARRASFVSVAVAGGVLVPGAPARVFVRVLGPDGAPIASRDVSVISAILGSVDGSPIGPGRTDADGLLALDVARVGEAAPDECGGTTSAAIEVVVGSERTAVCAPVDPDALLTLGAPSRVSPGNPVPVTIARTPLARGRAVILTALRRFESGWAPIAEEVVAPTATSATLTLEGGTLGEIWVRARVVLDGGPIVRGASTMLAVGLAPGALSLEADRDGARVSGAGAHDSVFVLSTAASSGEPPEVRQLVTMLAGDPSSDGRTAWLDGLALEAELAVRVPQDLGASAILRGGVVVPQAMPEAPVALGLLRDPFRTRARFVRGRLGRLFRAVESLVEARVPDRLGEVASQSPRGWTWNREMLAAAVSESMIDDEGSASLDGEPLDIDALVALEPTFTFDHVAARITRARLFRVVRAIREVTHQRNLDLPWARRGDPRTWIASLVGTGLDDGTSLETADLFDAWGRAFVFRPTSRRAFLPAIEGWEVASVGPDGRDGTADDLFDPFARVVPSGSLYAEAVGEDALVARLGGVAVGRAWVAQLEADDVDPSDGGDYGEPSSLGLLAALWAAAPTPLGAPPPIGGLAPLAQQHGAHLGEARAHRWVLPAERRSYTAVAISIPPSGPPLVASRTFSAGARLALRVSAPSFMRIGDRLVLPVVATALEGEQPVAIDLRVEGAGARATLTAIEREGSATTASLVLEATDVGAVSLVVSARAAAAEGEEVMEQRRRVRVLPGGALVAIHASALLAPGETLSLVRPAEAPRPFATTLSVSSPRTLDELPFFAALETADARSREGNAVVLAWARALGGELDASLASRAARAAGAGGLLDACAIVALSTTTEHTGSVSQLRRSLGAPADLRERAAMLVALAGTESPSARPSDDPIVSLFASLRADGWRALASERSAPSVMARVAAGLLLANAEDGPGRALHRSTLEALVVNEHGERVVPGDPTRPGDGWIGTLALALASRQIGDDALADELARAASRELHWLSRTRSEGPFWLLAASVFGALGGEAEAGDLALAVGGAEWTLSASARRDRLPIAPGDAVGVRGAAPVVAMLESRAIRELGERSEATFDARIEGVLGDASGLGTAGARAALELVVTSGATDVTRPVIEVELPALAELDEVARAALARAPRVEAVSGPDRGGVIRIALEPLREETTVRVPLVVAWTGTGRARGLAVVAYDAAEPARMTTHASRVVELGVSAREEER